MTKETAQSFIFLDEEEARDILGDDPQELQAYLDMIKVQIERQIANCEQTYTTKQFPMFKHLINSAR